MAQPSVTLLPIQREWRPDGTPAWLPVAPIEAARLACLAVAPPFQLCHHAGNCEDRACCKVHSSALVRQGSVRVPLMKLNFDEAVACAASRPSSLQATRSFRDPLKMQPSVTLHEVAEVVVDGEIVPAQNICNFTDVSTRLITCGVPSTWAERSAVSLSRPQLPTMAPRIAVPEFGAVVPKLHMHHHAPWLTSDQVRHRQVFQGDWRSKLQLCNNGSQHSDQGRHEVLTVCGSLVQHGKCTVRDCPNDHPPLPTLEEWGWVNLRYCPPCRKFGRRVCGSRGCASPGPEDITLIKAVTVAAVQGRTLFTVVRFGFNRATVKLELPQMKIFDSSAELPPDKQLVTQVFENASNGLVLRGAECLRVIRLKSNADRLLLFAVLSDHAGVTISDVACDARPPDVYGWGLVPVGHSESFKSNMGGRPEVIASPMVVDALNHATKSCPSSPLSPVSPIPLPPPTTTADVRSERANVAFPFQSTSDHDTRVLPVRLMYFKGYEKDPLLGFMARCSRARALLDEPEVPQGAPECMIATLWAAIEEAFDILAIPCSDNGGNAKASTFRKTLRSKAFSSWRSMPCLIAGYFSPSDSARSKLLSEILTLTEAADLLHEMHEARLAVVHPVCRDVREIRNRDAMVPERTLPLGSRATWWSATSTKDLHRMHIFAVSFVLSLRAIWDVIKATNTLEDWLGRCCTTQERKQYAKAASRMCAEENTPIPVTLRRYLDRIKCDDTTFQKALTDFKNSVKKAVARSAALVLRPSDRDDSARIRSEWLVAMFDPARTTTRMPASRDTERPSPRPFLTEVTEKRVATNRTLPAPLRLLFASIYVEHRLALRSSEPAQIVTVEVAHVMLLVGLRHWLAHGESTATKVAGAVTFLQDHDCLPADRVISDALTFWRGAPDREPVNPFAEHAHMTTPVVDYIINAAFEIAEFHRVLSEVELPAGAIAEPLDRCPLATVHLGAPARPDAGFLRIPEGHCAGAAAVLCPKNDETSTAEVRKKRTLVEDEQHSALASFFVTPDGEYVAAFVRILDVLLSKPSQDGSDDEFVIESESDGDV